MTRPKLPAIPLDQADRRVIGIGIILLLSFLVLAATLGLAVRVFLMTSGLGG